MIKTANDGVRSGALLILAVLILRRVLCMFGYVPKNIAISCSAILRRVGHSLCVYIMGSANGH